MATQDNLNAIQTLCAARLTALGKYVSPKDAMEVQGTTYNGADVIGVYQDVIDKRGAVHELRAQLAIALRESRDADNRRKEFDIGLRAWVTTKYGAASSEAHAFGFGPARVRRAPSAETKAHAVALMKATRNARGVIGKRKRALIKGVLPSAAPTQIAAPAVSAAPVAVPAHASNGTPTNG